MMQTISLPRLSLLALSLLLLPRVAPSSNDPDEFLIDDVRLLDMAPPGESESEASFPEIRMSGSSSMLTELQKKPETSKSAPPLDPTDPLQFTTHVRLGFEHNELGSGEGSNSFLRIQGNYAIDPKVMLHGEIPFGWSNLSHYSTGAGLGDLRFAIYYLAKNDPDERKLFQGVMPGFELLLPTGRATDGLGGDATLLIPYVDLRMRAGESVTVSNVLRYVHSTSKYRAAGNPDINVPSNSPGRDTQDAKTVREIWWQIPVSVKTQDMFLSWITLTPDFAWNFHNKTTRSYRLDFEAGKQLKEDFAISANFTIPLNDDNVIKWIFGIQAVLAF